MKPTVPKISYLCLLLAALASLPSASQSAGSDLRVRYVSTDHAYLDGGTADDLAEGDTLRVETDGASVSIVLVVEHAAAHSAACRIVAEGRPVQPGDLVRAIRAGAPSKPSGTSPPPPEVPLPASQAPAAPPTPPRDGISEISGYAAFQWYRFDGAGSGGVRQDRPTLRFQVKASRLWGKDISFHAKGRARHEARRYGYSDARAIEAWSNRIYAFSLAYGGSESPVTCQIGRLLSTALAPTGPVDGVLVDGRLSSIVRAGGFAGTLPDWRDSAPRSSLQKYGLFLSASRGAYGSSRWSSIMALTAEYHASTVSRQYIYQRNEWQTGRRWDFYEALEVDLNNGWRRAYPSGAISVTNALLTAGFRPTDRSSVTLSYDNRRNYRTWESRSLADSLFDTALRNGLRANARVNVGQSWSLSGNAGRQHRQGDTEDTWSWGAGLACSEFLANHLFMNFQITGFSGPWADGVNPSLSLRRSFNGGHQAAISSGAYVYTPGTIGARRTSRWARIEATRYVISRFYMSGQFEHDWGDVPKGNRLQAEVGMTF